MMELKGSKTEGNLKAAFAGESQANRRYLYFAAKADVEGQNDVAAVFRSTAEGETGHAHGHLRVVVAHGADAGEDRAGTGAPVMAVGTRRVERRKDRRRVFACRDLPGTEPAAEQQSPAGVIVEQREMAAGGHQSTARGKRGRARANGNSAQESRGLLPLEIVLEDAFHLGAGQQLIAGLSGEGLEVLERAGIGCQHMQHLPGSHFGQSLLGAQNR